MDITANIRGYGDLTPEGIRDSVWNAALANYQTTGSAGKTLSTASSGGVDLNALAAAVWAYATRELTSGALSTEQATQLAARQLFMHRVAEAANQPRTVHSGIDRALHRGATQACARL